jgi:hypothetical protein
MAVTRFFMVGLSFPRNFDTPGTNEQKSPFYQLDSLDFGNRSSGGRRVLVFCGVALRDFDISRPEPKAQKDRDAVLSDQCLGHGLVFWLQARIDIDAAAYREHQPN